MCGTRDNLYVETLKGLPILFQVYLQDGGGAGREVWDANNDRHKRGMEYGNMICYVQPILATPKGGRYMMYGIV